MRKRLGLFIAAVLAVSGGGAAAQQRIDRPGTITHEAAGAHFPERVGEFTRASVVRYDQSGEDISASYNLIHPDGRVVVTVYVYPSARTGSSARDTRARQSGCSREFEGVRAAIEAQNAGARPIEEGRPLIVPGVDRTLTHRSVYLFTGQFNGERQEVRTEAHLYCFVGDRWQVKYRISAPADLNADSAIERFIQSGPWPGRQPPPEPDEITRATDGTEARAG